MIIWDEKNEKIQKERNISFEEVAIIILKKDYLDIIENTSRPDQQVFVIAFKNYIYAVPFIIDSQLNIILKTVFPSRKLNKKYGRGDKNE